MNFTKRYFKLRDDLVQAINDSALPPLAAEQCLRELRAELLTVVERELREDANEEQGGNAQQLGNENPSPHQSPTETASPRGEADGRTEPSAPTEAGKED